MADVDGARGDTAGATVGGTQAPASPTNSDVPAPGASPTAEEDEMDVQADDNDIIPETASAAAAADLAAVLAGDGSDEFEPVEPKSASGPSADPSSDSDLEDHVPRIPAEAKEKQKETVSAPTVINQDEDMAGPEGEEGAAVVEVQLSLANVRKPAISLVDVPR